MYGEVRLDLPGDQRAEIGEFLSKFPGFADQAALAGRQRRALAPALEAVLAAGGGLHPREDSNPPLLNDRSAAPGHRDDRAFERPQRLVGDRQLALDVGIPDRFGTGELVRRDVPLDPVHLPAPAVVVEVLADEIGLASQLTHLREQFVELGMRTIGGHLITYRRPANGG